MRMRVHPPGERLAPFVRDIVVVEADEDVTRTLIPDEGLIVGLRYRGLARQVDGGAPARLPDAALTGVRDTPRRIFTSAGGGMVLATFRDARAAAFFAEPLDAIFGRTVPLDALVPRSEVARALDRVAAARDDGDRVAALASFLVERLRPDAADPLVAAAARALRAAHGNLRIDALARDLGISRDRLEKRFRRAAGTSPKRLAAIFRLRRAVELHRAGASLTRVAADAGYFDQSHFTREFRRFTGAAPRSLLGTDAYC